MNSNELTQLERDIKNKEKELELRKKEFGLNVAFGKLEGTKKKTLTDKKRQRIKFWLIAGTIAIFGSIIILKIILKFI
jgi:hypothetical protein